MNNFELELQEYIVDYCNINNIPIDIRFACFGDRNEFYTNETEFSLVCNEYYTEDGEDIKRFFTDYLNIMWENCNPPMNKLALYVKDIVDMDSWYEVVVGGAMFIDEALS